MAAKTTLLTDEQWAAMSPFLPAEPQDSQPANRDFVEASLSLWIGGIMWKDWPTELGDSMDAWRRFTAWHVQGIWAKVVPLLAPMPLLTETQWTAISPLLPTEPQDSQPHNRAYINGVLWMLFAGELGALQDWEAWPAELGNYEDAWKRSREWDSEGVWTKIATLLPGETAAAKLLHILLAQETYG